MGEHIESEQLDKVKVHEADLVLAIFSGGDKCIPLKVLSRVETAWWYDPLAEGQLTAPIAPSTSTNGVTNHTIVAPSQLGSSNVPGKPSDLTDYTAFPDLLAQLFVGIDPPALRVTVQAPFRIQQKTLPRLGPTGAIVQSGFIDGFMSPLTRPDPTAELWIAPGVGFALGYANVTSVSQYPLLRFFVNLLRVAVVRDANLAFSMMNGTAPSRVRFASIGGLQSAPYAPESYYNAHGITLDMTLAEVEAGIAPVNPAGKGPTFGSRPFI